MLAVELLDDTVRTLTVRRPTETEIVLIHPHPKAAISQISGEPHHFVAVVGLGGLQLIALRVI